MQLAQEDIRKTLNVQWSRELVAPVTAGEVLGTLSFTAPDGTPVSVVALKPGDKVIVGKYSGTQVKVGSEEYTIVRQSDVLAVVVD